MKTLHFLYLQVPRAILAVCGNIQNNDRSFIIIIIINYRKYRQYIFDSVWLLYHDHKLDAFLPKSISIWYQFSFGTSCPTLCIYSIPLCVANFSIINVEAYHIVSIVSVGNGFLHAKWETHLQMILSDINGVGRFNPNYSYILE